MSLTGLFRRAKSKPSESVAEAVRDVYVSNEKLREQAQYYTSETEQIESSRARLRKILYETTRRTHSLGIPINQQTK
jgi:IS1 family transposase